MKLYVCSVVLCSRPTPWVLLIQKKRPTWQRGLFNFPGGEIKDFESASQAMSRELMEETGVSVSPDAFRRFAALIGTDWQVIFGVTDVSDTKFSAAKTCRDEYVREFLVEHVARQPTLPDVPMLLALAMDKSNIQKPVILYSP